MNYANDGAKTADEARVEGHLAAFRLDRDAEERVRRLGDEAVDLCVEVKREGRSGTEDTVQGTESTNRVLSVSENSVRL